MIHDVRPVGRKDRLIDLKMRFCGISCSCDFCGSYYVCCLTMRISQPSLGFKMEGLQLTVIQNFGAYLQITCLVT